MELLNLTVNGMHCENCARALSASIGTLPGIYRVQARQETGTTTVAYDPQKTHPAAICKQIEVAGFEVVES